MLGTLVPWSSAHEAEQGQELGMRMGHESQIVNQDIKNPVKGWLCEYSLSSVLNEVKTFPPGPRSEGLV